MILVTGAGGKTGRAVIRALARHGETIRALVHRPEQASLVLASGAHETFAGDMRDQAAMDQAARGCRAIYHICPNVNPDELAIGRAAIQAARSGGVEHLVYHSVLHPQTEAMPHHWNKLRVEEQLFQSGLNYTILQPSMYMQNVLASWDPILEQGIYPVPYAAQTRLGMVDLEDVAEAAAAVLTQAGHAGATYELAGAEALSQIEIAEILSRGLQRPVRVEVVPREAWKQRALSSGLGEYAIETLQKMFSYYERHGFWGNAHVLTWLLNRPPTTLADFIKRTSLL